ncbi:hypothetical protein EON63_10210, partial [archaeon]
MVSSRSASSSMSVSLVLLLLLVSLSHQSAQSTGPSPYVLEAWALNATALSIASLHYSSYGVAGASGQAP